MAFSRKMRRPRWRSASARDQLAEALRTLDWTRKIATRGRVESRATKVLESPMPLGDPDFWVATLGLMTSGAWEPDELERILGEVGVSPEVISRLSELVEDETEPE
jgi:hypothetical protein